MYQFVILVTVFFIYSVVGWLIEVTRIFLREGKFVDRGFLIGPLLPIYGTGGVLTLLLDGFKGNIFVFFIMSTIACSILEYLTSYIMEKVFKTRWWDYSDRKFNINGRVCLSNMILFGLACTFTAYYVNPGLITFLYKIDPLLLKTVAIILTVIILVDFVVSTSIISNIKGLSENMFKDSTEEVSAKVKEVLLSKGVFNRRIARAFPDFKVDIRLLGKRKKAK